MLRPKKKHSLQNEFLALHTFIQSPSSHCFPSVLFSWEGEAQAFIGQCIHTAERCSLKSIFKNWTSSSFLRAQPWAMPAVDPGCPPHQQQLCPEGEGVERGWDSPSHCKELFLVLTCLQVVFSPAPGHSNSSSWLQYLDLELKVQVIIIFSSSFRKAWDILCSGGHPARRSELRKTLLLWAGMGNRFCNCQLCAKPN